MELKVSVNGVQRVVCGVTDKTTCQEVVIALAQALGRTGRYMLKEKFKEYERNVNPGERLLESLAKYGQQAREVQLTLQHKGPSFAGGGVEGLNRGSHQASAMLRRKDASGRGRIGGSNPQLHRQSLPPFSDLCLTVELPQTAEAKKIQRKSLTLVEEARGWLDSLSRSGRYQWGREKCKSKDCEQTEVCNSPTIYPSASIDCSSQGGSVATRIHKKTTVDARQQRTSWLGDFVNGSSEDWKVGDEKVDQNKNMKEANVTKDKAAEQENPKTTSPMESKGDNGELHALLIWQQAILNELQLQVLSTDSLIQELEEKQIAHQNQEAQEALTEDDEEQLKYWENELKAEEVYERDLQEQFLEMKEKAAECKVKLEEYKCKLQGLDPARSIKTLPEVDLQLGEIHDSSHRATSPTAPNGLKPQPDSLCEHFENNCWQDEELPQPTPTSCNRVKGNVRRVSIMDPHLPYVQVPLHQMDEPQFGGPHQLRECWIRWSQVQPEVIPHLGSTRI